MCYAYHCAILYFVAERRERSERSEANDRGLFEIFVYIYIYIHKEELKTVVCKLLACTQLNRHETFTALWNPYPKVSSRRRRAQILFSREARGKKPENDRLPFWFYGESIQTSVHGSHIFIVEASWECCFFYGAP